LGSKGGGIFKGGENQTFGLVPNWEEDWLANEAFGEAPEIDSD
jgi:hypothetical protein